MMMVMMVKLRRTWLVVLCRLSCIMWNGGRWAVGKLETSKKQKMHKGGEDRQLKNPFYKGG